VASRAEPHPLADDHGVYGAPGDLSPWDIRFDPEDRAHLDFEADGSARIRVWTEPELVEALLVVRSGRSVESHALREVARTVRFTFWEVVAGPFRESARFTFAFRAPNGKGVYLAPSGVTNAIERLDRWAGPAASLHSVPEWSKGAVIYQLFPDRFARLGAADTDLDPWGSPPSSTRFQGGDLAGVVGRLDYLSDLGVDLLYLNPVFTSPSNHRYDTIDYHEVDPLLGGNEALRNLVDEAHRRSIRIILDGSFNHVHPEFFAFRDVAERGPASAYWDWFLVDEWPLRLRVRPDRAHSFLDLAVWVPVWESEIGVPSEVVHDDGPAVEPSYQAWYGVPTMPRVNLTNPDARAYMLDVAAHWVMEYGIDGWRMDVARYVDPDFWDDFRRVVRAARPDAYLLCEVMGDASDWLQGNRFDATMNYTFRELCIRFFATGDIAADEFCDRAARLWAQYSWPVTLANQNLIGSHDTARFLTEAGGEEWRLRLATIFQMTYPGAPGIYYGDEMGMSGGEDPGSRGAMDWESTGPGHGIHSLIRELTELRRKEPALATGEWRALSSQADLVVIERRLIDRCLLVLINRSSARARYEASGASHEVLWGEGAAENGAITVGPRSGLVIAQ
jgi:neopullulanase